MQWNSTLNDPFFSDEKALTSELRETSVYRVNTSARGIWKASLPPFSVYMEDRERGFKTGI